MSMQIFLVLLGVLFNYRLLFYPCMHGTAQYNTMRRNVPISPDAHDRRGVDNYAGGRTERQFVVSVGHLKMQELPISGASREFQVFVKNIPLPPPK